jgi:hypothetical protein
MKNTNLINYCLICFLIFLILYNLLKYRENIENSCPTKEELNELREQNEKLNLKLDKNQKTIEANQKTIDEKNKAIENNKIQNKINSVKSFCDEAKANFEALNEKVLKNINSMKEEIKKNQEKKQLKK